MTIDQCLREFGQLLGTNELQFSSARTCCLKIQNQFELTIEESADQEGVYLYGSVGQLPQRNRESIMQNLLQAQLFGSRTADAYFGLQPATEELLLIRRLETSGLKPEQLLQAAQNLVNWVASWQIALSDQDDRIDPTQGETQPFLPV